MPSRTCPQCGFVQEGGEECGRCGVVFARVHRSRAAAPRPAAPVVGKAAESSRASQPDIEDLPRRGWFGRAYRVFRWVALAVSLTVLALILRKSAPPAVAVDAAAPARAEDKIRQAYAASATGPARPAELSEAELNGWLQRNLALARASSATPNRDSSVEEMRSNVRDLKVQLVDDHVRTWVLFHVYGKDLTLTLDARVFAQGGSLRLDPIAGWLGSMPIPAAALARGFGRALSDPANAEELRLPPDVADVRVEGGRLIVVPVGGVQ
jgi:hypothetical protein